MLHLILSTRCYCAPFIAALQLHKTTFQSLLCSSYHHAPITNAPHIYCITITTTFQITNALHLLLNFKNYCAPVIVALRLLCTSAIYLLMHSSSYYASPNVALHMFLHSILFCAPSLNDTFLLLCFTI